LLRRAAASRAERRAACAVSAARCQVLNMRPKTLSATVMATSAFFTKPGESLAPMLGWALVNGAWGGGGEGAEGAGMDDGRRKILFYCLVWGAQPASRQRRPAGGAGSSCGGASTARRRAPCAAARTPARGAHGVME